MSSIKSIFRLLKQTAVYWGTPTENGTGGFTYAAAVEITCRWEDHNEVLLKADGDTIVASSVVYSTTDLQEQGYLFLGTLDDLDSDTSDPLSIDNCKQIQRRSAIASVDGAATLYKYNLK